MQHLKGQQLLEVCDSRSEAEKRVHVHAKATKTLGLEVRYGVKVMEYSGAWGVWLVDRRA